MTSSANSIRTAVAAVIAAAALLTSASVPVQAEYQRAPHEKRKITKYPKYQRAPHVKRKLTRMEGSYALKCRAHWGDLAGVPGVINISGKTIPIGAQIRWRMNFYDGSPARTGTHILTKPLRAGGQTGFDQVSSVGFRCVAAAFI